jgi:hypothetical protein
MPKSLPAADKPAKSYSYTGPKFKNKEIEELSEDCIATLLAWNYIKEDKN